MTQKPKKPGSPRDKRAGRPRGSHAKGLIKPKSPQKAQSPSLAAKGSSKEGFIEVKLKGMAHGGFALGSHKGRVTLVPYSIPGEIVQARIVDSQKTVDFAEGVQLVDASADRVYPQCVHFGIGRCWGCQWQHIDYPAQLLLKQDVLADQLYRLGHFDDETLERAMRPFIASPQQWAYNYNMSFERSSTGQLGLFRADGRSIEPIQLCQVLHPDLQALYDILDLDFAEMRGLSLWLGSDGETMMLIHMKSEDVPELQIDLPTSINVILPDNEPVSLLGDSVVNYLIGGRWFRMTAGGNFRANLPQIENLIGEILNILKLTEDDAVLDLYAGVGVFSAFIASRAGLVTLVESYPPMATDAEENLKDFENVDIVEGAVEDVLQALIEAGERYTAAIIDPPSSGLSKAAFDSIITLNIPRLLYIGSEPASLARDAQNFVKHGYRLKRVQGIDFAPQTYYIDALLVLEKV